MSATATARTRPSIDGLLGRVTMYRLVTIVLSAINLWLIPDVINQVPVRLGLTDDVTGVSTAVYGFLLVIMMIMRPQGLLTDKRDHR